MTNTHEELTTIGEVRQEIRNCEPLQYCLMLNFRDFKADMPVNRQTFLRALMAACDGDSVNAYIESGTLYLHTR